MTVEAIVYLGGVLPAAVVGAVDAERERRTSKEPRVRRATLQPGLDGIVVGIAWPVVAAVAAFFGLVALFALVGRLGAGGDRS